MADAAAAGGLRKHAEHPVVQLEFERCRALERSDFDILDAIFAETLTYVHSTGSVHDRAQLMEYLRSSVRFSHVQRSSYAVSHWGSLAICTGLMRLEGYRLADNVPFASVSFATQAWTNHGTGWRLELMQSTRVADTMWPIDGSSNTTGTIDE